MYRFSKKLTQRAMLATAAAVALGAGTSACTAPPTYTNELASAVCYGPGWTLNLVTSYTIDHHNGFTRPNWISSSKGGRIHSNFLSPAGFDFGTADGQGTAAYHAGSSPRSAEIFAPPQSFTLTTVDFGVFGHCLGQTRLP